MEKWDVRLLSASYTRDEDVTVQLFGRTREGKSITALYHGFKPYFYVVEPKEDTLRRLKADKDVLKIEGVELFYHGQDKKCAKVTVRFPWTVPDYRNRYRECEFLAADIPFGQRFCYDMDIGGCFTAFGELTKEKINYTTELVVRAERFEKCEHFKPKLKILSFDIENSIRDQHLYMLGAAIRDADGKLRTVHYEGEERDIIAGFVDLVRREDPDVLTGYNIDGYDIPMLKKRGEANKLMSLRLGRDGGDTRSVGERFWRAHGRIIADAWWNAKMELRPKQETLDAISRLVLGESKADVDPSNMDREWAENREKVIEYCVRDAELALRILEKIAILEKHMDLATVAKLPLDDVVNGRTSTLIDSILIREADRHSIAVPMTRHEKRTDQIEGGYVHSIDPGIYPWVIVLDFKSMYPSIIISKNICFTTLSDSGEIVSPTGTRFVGKEVRQGLLPHILTELMKWRDETKANMKRAKTDEERRYFDGLQNAIKVLMNAVYGVFASAFYRFTDKKIGESITAFARENTKSIIRQLEAEGLKIVYGDTDSVFVQSPKDDLEGAVEFGKSLSKRYSKEGATLEFEKLLNPMFSHGAKKRYVGRIMWPTEGRVVRGYETRRTDAFDHQSESLEAVFDRILANDPEGALEIAKKAVKDCSEGKVPLEKLIVSRTCREFSEYKDADSQVTVQAARKILKLGYEFVPGMKVSWVVVDGHNTPQEVEPYLSGRPFTAKPDYDHYARRTAMTLARVTDMYGWDVKDLMTGSQQSSLMAGKFSEKKPAASRKKEDGVPKKASKAQTLEDFL